MDLYHAPRLSGNNSQLLRVSITDSTLSLPAAKRRGNLPSHEPRVTNDEILYETADVEDSPQAGTRMNADKTLAETDLPSPAFGRNQKRLTRRHEATKNDRVRVVLTSVSLCLCVRYGSLFPMDLYRGRGIIRREFPVVTT